jgi:hypothetical protein
MSASTVSDAQVLAALERAHCHAWDPRWVGVGQIMEHLGLDFRSAAGRSVRLRFPGLQAAGLMEHERRKGRAMWTLTNAGRECLRRERQTGRVELPESPQHRRWRESRALAAEHIERVQDAFEDTLLDALALAPIRSAHSDVWIALARRLERHALVVASVTHCLHEWPEPRDDEREAHSLRPGLRDTGWARRRHQVGYRQGNQA